MSETLNLHPASSHSGRDNYVNANTPHKPQLSGGSAEEKKRLSGVATIREWSPLAWFTEPDFGCFSLRWLERAQIEHEMRLLITQSSEGINMCKQFDWSLVESPLKTSVSVQWNVSGAQASGHVTLVNQSVWDQSLELRFVDISWSSGVTLGFSVSHVPQLVLFIWTVLKNSLNAH